MADAPWDDERPIVVPPLPEGAVQVWLARLADAAPDAALVHADAVLSDEERARAVRAAASRRREFVAGRRLLRRVLGAQLGTAPRAVPIVLDPTGKPRLAPIAPGTAADALRFSLAHAGDVLLVAVSRAGDVGVDVERIDPTRDHAAITARYFASEEQVALAATPEAQRVEAFTRCWTRKEAMVKAIGTGIAGGLTTFVVPVTVAPMVRLVRAPDGWDAPGPPGAMDGVGSGRGWVLRDLEVPPGYLASLALRGADTPVSVFRVAP